MKKKLKNILLIDDNGDDNFYHSFILQEMNCCEEITAFLKAEEALNLLGELAEEALPELILLDINMPTLNGWEFINQYNHISNLKKSNSKLFVLSSSNNPDDKNRAENLGIVSGFYIKPLTEQSVEKMIEVYFDTNK